uniref:Transmembrane protein n=1 Tax=Heterorhabditis bacteriophora TaxID=37862 RepID=A0A1I7W9X5_HETBA
MPLEVSLINVANFKRLLRNNRYFDHLPSRRRTKNFCWFEQQHIVNIDFSLSLLSLSLCLCLSVSLSVSLISTFNYFSLNSYVDCFLPCFAKNNNYLISFRTYRNQNATSRHLTFFCRTKLTSIVCCLVFLKIFVLFLLIHYLNSPDCFYLLASVPRLCCRIFRKLYFLTFYWSRVSATVFCLLTRSGRLSTARSYLNLNVVAGLFLDRKDKYPFYALHRLENISAE